MSIIQDALKKADNKSSPRGNLSVGYAQARDDGTVQTVTVKSDVRMSARYIAYAVTLIILVSILAVSHFSTPRTRNTSVPAIPKYKAEPIRIAQPIARPAEKKISAPKEPVAIKPAESILQKEPVPQPDQFTLSGIMHLEDGPRAIINNTRVAKGEDVDGAEVISITDDTVVLKKQGSEIKLRLR